MKTEKLFIPLLAALPLAMCCSCVDDKYDLSQDIDLTIQVGGSDLAVPGGSTEAIALSKILKVNEGDLVKIDPITGDYYLAKMGDRSVSKISVPTFSVDEPVISPIVKKLGFNLSTGAAATKATGNVFTATLDPDDFKSDFDISGSNIPDEVKALTRIDADIAIQVQILYNTSMVKKVTIKEIDINLPSYLVIEGADAGNVVKVKNVELTSGVPHVVSITAKGIKMTDEMFNAATHTVLFDGRVSLGGTLSLNATDINVSSLTNPEIEIQANVSIKDAKAKDGNIYVSTVAGKVNPTINIDVEPIALDDLPDFLSDEDVVLDVANPMVYITAENYTPVKAIVDAQFAATSKWETVNVVTPEFAIPSMAQTLLCLSPLAPDNQSATHIVVPELPSLVDKIPDQISISITAAAADEEIEIDLGSDYTIATDYEVKVPFSFGDNLKIVYTDTVGDWNEDIEDFDFERINVTATAVNNIPLDVQLTAIPLGKAQANGVRPALEGITARVVIPSQQDNIIRALSTSDIVVEIVETVAGSVKKLDGVALHIAATANPSVAADKRIINKNQTFQLSNVKLKVPGGVKVDLN